MTTHDPRWGGLFPALTTQFDRDGGLDLRATARHAEALVAAGMAGVIACGSLGENQALAPDEKRAVLRTVVEAVGRRVPVLSGVAETSTRAAIDYVRDGERLGAAGYMVMPPMVYRAPAEEALHYFRRVAAATSLPWMLYNNPIGYSVDVTPAQMAGLADVPNLVAMKESSGNTRRITELRLVVGDRYRLFVGVDDLALESAVLGLDGWVVGSGVAFPRENQHLWNLIQAGRWDEARAVNRWFFPLSGLDTHVKFVQYIKLAVQEVGLGAEWVREPRLPLVGAERDRVLAVIHAGIAGRPRLD